MTDADRRFAATGRLLGADSSTRLQRAHAVVVGVGGVGSWAAEALARSGVGNITLIDLDQIAESNINRQVHALESTIGAAKVGVMAERLRQIAPLARIHAVEEFIEPGNLSALMPRRPTVVIDAIDAITAKAALIAWCVAGGLPVIACGAAGGRRDPLQLRSDDLARTSGDSLLASLRSRLRREYGFPAAVGASGHGLARAPRFKVAAVFSPEPASPGWQGDAAPGNRAGAPLACSGYGSIVTVTASMGMAAAAIAIEAIMKAADVADVPSDPLGTDAAVVHSA